MPIDPSDFAQAFQELLHNLNSLVPPSRNRLLEAVTAHLGVNPMTLSSVSQAFHPSDHPNVQLALNAMRDEAQTTGGPEWELIGLPTDLRNYGGFSLVGVLGGRGFGGQVQPGPVEYASVPVSLYDSLPCVQLGIYLARMDDEPVVVMIDSGSEHGPRRGLTLEALAVDQTAAERLFARVRELMHELNVYRGKVLTFSFTEYGGFGLQFAAVPVVERDDLILPEDDLVAIERHTVGIAERASALLAAGRHLKRGLLLYGPPGTGKTLSVMYLATGSRGAPWCC